MWRCCSFLFFLTHRFSSKHKMKSSTELFTSWSDYINHFYFDIAQIAGPSIHSPIKEVSILAGLLLLCLLPLPHRRPSTSRLCPPCQPRLCALSCSQVDIEVPSSWIGIWMVLISAPQFPLFLWKTFTVICYSDPFYGPYYLLHHVWSQVTSFCHY